MGLYLLIPTFIVILVSVLIVRAGGIALRMTGLDEQTANFQALSAFSRARFTTKESESVVSHPQRRTIITWLIILGNAGIVAVIVTGTSSLATSTDYRIGINIGILAVGIYIVYRLFKYTGFTRRWENFVENRLIRGRFFTRIPKLEHILHFGDGYGIIRTSITEKSLLHGVSIKESGVSNQDLFILGIQRGGQWMSNPVPEELVIAGDTVFFYGRIRAIEQAFGKQSNRK